MPTDDTTPTPPVREMLIAKVDELVGMTSRDLDEIRAVTDQLEPTGPSHAGSWSRCAG